MALNSAASFGDGECVVYVMSRDQRVADNHALLEAQEAALEQKLPLVVLFCLYPAVGYRSREQYKFMLAGLREVEASLQKLDIGFHFVTGNPKNAILSQVEKLRPATLYFDFSPLRGPQTLQKLIATKSQVQTFTIDTHNVVPVWVASDKQEYAARTLRPKLHRQLADWLVAPSVPAKHPHSYDGALQTMESQADKVRKLLGALQSTDQQLALDPGETAAHRQLDLFIRKRLAEYSEGRNDPTQNGQSDLSPYLHFGQISSLRVALEIMATDAPAASKDTFIEELIVRKELSDNFCYYNNNYDQLAGAPDWALRTLHAHADDPREFTYRYGQLLNAQTHDNAWNAAQKQLTKTGKIHGYMRMYWAKKVLEWTESPEQAVAWLIQLNDQYSLDGGDPNGYVGILWSVAGVHDRPWFERSIYGSIRYMSRSGLDRKFAVDKYIGENL